MLEMTNDLLQEDITVTAGVSLISNKTVLEAMRCGIMQAMKNQSTFTKKGPCSLFDTQGSLDLGVSCPPQDRDNSTNMGFYTFPSNSTLTRWYGSEYPIAPLFPLPSQSPRDQRSLPTATNSSH